MPNLSNMSLEQAFKKIQFDHGMLVTYTKLNHDLRAQKEEREEKIEEMQRKYM